MQTSRRETEQARQEMTAGSDYVPYTRPIRRRDRYRVLLNITVFYPYVLFLGLFAAFLLKQKSAGQAFIINAAGVCLGTAGFLLLSYWLVSAVLRERTYQRRSLSRANCLISISDVLSSGLSVRQKMKRIGRLLAEEGEYGGWRCRLVLQENPDMLPPESDEFGTHIPITAGEKLLGALLVTAPQQKLATIDQNFLDIVSRSIGFFVYREKQWDEFHAELKRLEGALLLNSPASPAPDDAKLTVEHMLSRLGLK